MISVAEAQSLILAEARGFGIERVSLEKSFGRVLAQDVVADRDYPPFNRATMDGYAVVAKAYSAANAYEVTKTILAGDMQRSRTMKKRGESAIRIMTGAAVPPPFDAVIRREDAHEDSGTVRFDLPAVGAWHNIARQGEDLKAREKIATKGSVIDGVLAGLLASLGIDRPAVAKLPRVAIVTTGREVVPAGKKPRPHEIRNANLFALRALLNEYNIASVRTLHVVDDRKQISRAIAAHLDCDILLLTGGVSAGDSDFVPEVLAENGVKKIFHKVAMKPGKPLWFGARRKTAVFAIPGNPFSCQVVFKVFVAPFLRRALGLPPAHEFSLPLQRARQKKDTLQHYFPVRLVAPGVAASSGSLEAISFNSSGDVRAALFSNGIARHPAEATTVGAGALVDFLPWRVL